MSNRVVRTLNYAWAIFKYVALAAALGLVLLLILLGSAYRDLSNAGRAGLAGKNYLDAATRAAQLQNWDEALNQTVAARTEFSAALDSLGRSRQNLVVKNFSPVRQQIDDLDYLLQTAQILSRSLERVLPLVQQLDKIRASAPSHNFSDLPEADKKYFLQIIYESAPEFTGLKANLDLARWNLAKIHRLGILYPIYAQISDIKNQLDGAADLLTKISPLIKLLPALAGYPDTSKFLLILQNNDELRPTGGFIGSYGLLEIQNGLIISLNTDDSYHLDMPSSLNDKWQIEPPAPLKKYLKVEKWYLRDANWSPDWPTSAQKILEIYNGENQANGQAATNFTGLVAINPDLVADLIKLVGPITVKNTTYNADDFQSLLQYNVEIGYKDQDISSWDRKDIINELVAELKQRLLSLPSDRWMELLKIFNRRLTTKDIQLYFFNPAWESLARTLDATGEVKNFPGDYFLVVDANFGAFKSDVVVKKNISYALRTNNDKLEATLKINYRHEGGFDWRTTRYRSYTRVLAPRGSQLISLTGIDQATADISVTDDPILEKTVFGFFLTVEPGTSREITLNYRLPEAVYQQFIIGNYQLLAQKQSGQRVEELKLLFESKNGKTQQIRHDFANDQLFDPAIFNQ